MKIRFATISDALSLLEIYSQYIETAITFEYILPTKSEFEKRIENIIETYPYLVLEEDGKIIGYAYAHKYMERAAYQWNAEISIYLDKAHVSKGLGKKLCLALIEILKAQGVKTVYSLITSPNIKSEKLHLSLGFKNIGMYHNTGYKRGEWRNVSIFEKQIGEYSINPNPVLSIKEIGFDIIEKIINENLSDK
ncbi:GNAT family N-acetyltransferase [Brachyspira catarrhinii]|uniref:N-acetyltransferase family protein n=1 Tax=Brachyspira catarrhinii TaxID=2528966 RepID=A0ABY2TP76_9SPIR|nr:GNAT family N-acetyltransferase [Brachyspira catarrhinii]TKZ32515.1 N-acetyltransferase family protein [Brachyspira catarrhinii]